MQLKKNMTTLYSGIQQTCKEMFKQANTEMKLLKSYNARDDRRKQIKQAKARGEPWKCPNGRVVDVLRRRHEDQEKTTTKTKKKKKKKKKPKKKKKTT